MDAVEKVVSRYCSSNHVKAVLLSSVERETKLNRDVLIRELKPFEKNGKVRFETIQVCSCCQSILNDSFCRKCLTVNDIEKNQYHTLVRFSETN